MTDVADSGMKAWALEAHWGWAGDAATPMESTAREAARIHERVPRNARLGLESRDWLEIFILVCMYFVQEVACLKLLNY